MKKVGIVIFLLGLGLTVFSTVTFFTNKKVAEIGKIEITRKVPHRLDVSPVTGIAIMGIGGILFWQTYNDQ